jgi:hypothetical protein
MWPSRPSTRESAQFVNQYKASRAISIGETLNPPKKGKSGSASLEDKVQEVEKRVQYLEERVEFLVGIADPEKDPFAYLVLESGLTKGQMNRIFDLMDEVERTIRADKPMQHFEFEQRVYEIVPSHTGDYHFAENIVSTLHEAGRWQAVYQQMKRNGMNI